MNLGVFQFSTDYSMPIGELACEVEDRDAVLSRLDRYAQLL